MKSIREYAADHAAVKYERAYVGVDVTRAQAEENGDFTEEMLRGTGIDLDELYAVTGEAIHSVADALVRAGESVGPALLEIIGSVWIDGVVLGSSFVRDANRDPELWTP